MTLGELLPIRLGMLARAPRTRHRAVDEVDRQKALRVGADLRIKALVVQLDDLERKLAATATRQAEAEELVVQQQADIDELTAERDALAEEVATLKLRFAAQLAADANAHRVTVPCGYRDTAAIEDQATGPIDVRTLWNALGIAPVTDPGRIH
jgi:cell division protein FtsB